MDKNEIDISNQIIYAPSINNRWQAGLKFISHEDIHKDDFLEQDLLIGPYASFSPNESLSFEAEILYMKKLTWIYQIVPDMGILSSDSLALRGNINYSPLKWLTVRAEMASYTSHSYPIFCAPNFLLGFDFKITYFFTAGFSMDAQYIDMFTLSGNLSNIGISSYAKIKI